MITCLGYTSEKKMASNTPVATFKYKFVSEPDGALKCPICLEVAKEPWQHSKCGKLFCKKCLDDYGRINPCPTCRAVWPQYFEDNKSKKDINALTVKCDNVDRKCEWVGTVDTLEKHVAACKFTLLPCHNKCKDDNNEVMQFMRKDLDKHLKKDCPNRNHSCDYCGEKGMYATITQVHDNKCQKKILPCRNAKAGCPKSMQRQEINKHVNTECEHAVIACKYVAIGCKTALMRKDMAAHEEDDSLHLHTALDKINSLEEKSITLKNGESMTFELSEYQKRKENKDFFLSPFFYTHPNGYYMAIRVYVNGVSASMGTHISCFVNLFKGKYDAVLKWPFIGEVTITFLNQIEDKDHISQTVNIKADDNMQPGGEDNWGFQKTISHSMLDYDPVRKTQYLKDDTLYFRVSVDLPFTKPAWLQCKVVK